MIFKDWIKYYRSLGNDGMKKKLAQADRIYEKYKDILIIDEDGVMFFYSRKEEKSRLDLAMAHSDMITYAINHYHLILSPEEYNG